MLNHSGSKRCGSLIVGAQILLNQFGCQEEKRRIVIMSCIKLIDVVKNSGNGSRNALGMSNGTEPKEEGIKGG